MSAACDYVPVMMLYADAVMQYVYSQGPSGCSWRTFA